MAESITSQSVVPPTSAEAAAAGDVWVRHGYLGRLVHVERDGERRAAKRQATIEPVVESA